MIYDVKTKFIECYNEQETISKKMKLLKLYDLYKNIINTNYIAEEEELYRLCNGSNKAKIKLEIKRLINILSDDRTNYDAIRKIISLYYESENINYDSENDVKEMFSKIIDLELDLDVPIGLYKETIEYFLQKINQPKTAIFDYTFKDYHDNTSDVYFDINKNDHENITSYYYKLKDTEDYNNKRI